MVLKELYNGCRLNLTAKKNKKADDFGIYISEIYLGLDHIFSRFWTFMHCYDINLKNDKPGPEIKSNPRPSIPRVDV